MVKLFVAMPPFDMIRYLLVRAASGRLPPLVAAVACRRPKRQVLFIDVSKEHLYAPAEVDANATDTNAATCAIDVLPTPKRSEH